MASGRATRSSKAATKTSDKPNAKPTSTPSNSKARQTKNGSANKRKREDSDSEVEANGEEYIEEEEEEEKVYDSDALDESDDEVRKNAKAKSKGRAAKASPKKRRRKTQDDDEEDEDDGLDLKEGQVVVGKVVQAPKTGRVPPGQISKNTFNFLKHLKDPKCNDREWFKLHEPVYRQAEKEFKDFVEAFTDLLVETDTQIPHLPPKDVIHRIYRDIRFSNDKTPYKTGFSASFSRSGRKGIFACYHIAVKPGNQSVLAAGLWCPGKNELQTVRTNLQQPNGSRRLREVIAHPTFVKFFGPPKPHPKGERQNIFGMDDELKVAPKGVDKNHKDIDLLKLRSFAVAHYFTDSEVLDPGFAKALVEVANVVRPFVHCLNDLITVGHAPPDANGEGDGGEDEDGEDGEQEGEGEGEEGVNEEE